MPMPVEIRQLIARAVNHTAWNTPKNRDGDRWRNSQDSHLFEKLHRINGYDFFDGAIYRVKQIIHKRGWEMEIADAQEICHPHLLSLHYRLKRWKNS